MSKSRPATVKTTTESSATQFAIRPKLVEKPWGGDWLAQRFNQGATDGENLSKIGEAWLLSTLPDGESQLNDRPLSEMLGGPLPFVVKIIDAHENLSVQVHPNDEWARQLENSRGKTECWLVLEAKPEAGVYLGLKSDSKPRQFENDLRLGKSVAHELEFFQVKRGDFISVPAGTVHAIGAGVTLLEVQQASGITYRLWDWGRPGRDLHLDKGLRVTSYAKKFSVQRDVLNAVGRGRLYEHSDFECYLNESRGDGWFINLETYLVTRSTPTKSKAYLFVCSKAE